VTAVPPRGRAVSRRSGGGRPHDLDLDDADEVLLLTSREWLRGSDLQAALLPRRLGFLCRFQQWAIKEKNAYETMVCKNLRHREGPGRKQLEKCYDLCQAALAEGYALSDQID
jgi:hypothetical protein